MTTGGDAVASVTAWLDKWADAIASNDIPRGEALFAPEASGFGTVTLRTQGRADLIERQWRQVWPRTRGFEFDRETMAIHVSPDARLASVQALWRSFSNQGAGGEDIVSDGIVSEGIGGEETGAGPAEGGRERRGRATIVMTRAGASAPWSCVHTHFSMWPDMADLDILAKARL